MSETIMFTNDTNAFFSNSNIQVLFDTMNRTFGTKYSRVDQVKFMEDVFHKFYFVHS